MQDTQPLLIVGLGNPGTEYEKTRHNVAWILLDEILDDANWEFDKYAQADVYADEDVVYLKPQTFMNNSGMSVKYLADKHAVGGDHIVVVHDDIDLPLGRIKISYNAGDGGHNGVKSIADHLGSAKFVRVRIGVSPGQTTGDLERPAGRDQRDFVLKNFEVAELDKVKSLATDLKKILKTIQDKGHDEAMNNFN
jgi:PTH1 family peptidyl-tRNA hydrolase